MKHIRFLKAFLNKLSMNAPRQIVFFVLTMTILLIGYSKIMIWIQRDIELIEDDFSWVYQIDSINEKDNELIITGWAFELNIDAAEERFDIYIYDKNTGKMYYPDIEYFSREEVGNYFACEYDYSMSGFVATITAKSMDLQNDVYEVILRPKNKRIGFYTNVYYVDNQTLFVNPENYVCLETENTYLNPIVTEGILRVYRPDVGMYVYQYNNELYWIAEEYYGFIDGDSFVEYQMDTTQKNKLPSNRIENNWLWSNLGFPFSSKELIDVETGRYRVAKCELPTDYSIVKIWTGNYINKWIWEQDFRPWYEFE